MYKGQRHLKLNRKKEVEDLLSSLSEEDFNTIKSILNKPSPRPKKKRGRGGRKRKKKEVKKEVKKEDIQDVDTPAFLDGVGLSATEAAELNEAASSDKKQGLYRPKPSSIKARKSSKVNVSCRVCGKKEEISPALAGSESGRYKCNKCSCMAG